MDVEIGNYAPFSKARTSEAVAHNSGGKLGPMRNEGRTVTRSIPFLLQNSHAAFSARVLDKAYQVFTSIFMFRQKIR